jgi:hypothetical protein
MGESTMLCCRTSSSRLGDPWPAMLSA